MIIAHFISTKFLKKSSTSEKIRAACRISSTKGEKKDEKIRINETKLFD